MTFVWTKLPNCYTIMIVYIPKVSHNSFEISGYLLYYTISYTVVPYHISTNCLLISWPLDANYKRVDLQSVVKDKCKHLTTDQKKKLLQLLTKYESLFDGTLGDWKTKLVSFQLKAGASPYHG